jgi:Arc/MetJ-type ribon-helix-helix transcriptional regulator
MNIALNAETQRLIEEQMKRDEYPTADDLIRAGLESLQDRHNSEEFDEGELDRLLAEGEQGGPPLDGEQVLAELGELRTRPTNKAG